MKWNWYLPAYFQGWGICLCCYLFTFFTTRGHYKQILF